MIPYSKLLAERLKKLGHNAQFIQRHKDIDKGDILVILSCERIIKKDRLTLHRHNLVVHESALPKGKGWSPLTWQILEGKKQIPITLFEASMDVDSGDIYDQRIMEFEGWELIDDLRRIQAKFTMEMVLDFVNRYPYVKPMPQQGKESFYARRRPEDSILDIDKTIRQQFNLLRVVDNQRYPAFFNYMGKKYILKIEMAPDEAD